MGRAAAVDRVERIVEAVESEPMPVPVREVWAFGDVVLGLDPVARLDVYVTKDLLFKDRPGAEAEFEASHGMQGVGKTVSADWAEAFPEHLRANANGHAAPEKCLGAHLLPEDEPVHLEVCNTGFEDNVTQRLRGAQARGDWTQVLDPRAACLWVDTEDGGVRSEEAFRKLRAGEFVFPTLSESLSMLGLDEAEANAAADAVRRSRAESEGASVRGDVV
ncbi:hypothetical protein N0B31_15895 [Salinirubellus salinus]|uniref:Uncharacterized protein n=1 Tax=Salinirubellus salinus TaxID=1364945 RepID=A0A9E7R7C4_9EURY|nr:hypothetical protein [Salinirubellus salinus]UWM56887.1 hypothetical protein N0B31_15895 [Salinirubellus salinus]